MEWTVQFMAMRSVEQAVKSLGAVGHAPIEEAGPGGETSRVGDAPQDIEVKLLYEALIWRAREGTRGAAHKAGQNETDGVDGAIVRARPRSGDDNLAVGLDHHSRDGTKVVGKKRGASGAGHAEARLQAAVRLVTRDHKR